MADRLLATVRALSWIWASLRVTDDGQLAAVKGSFDTKVRDLAHEPGQDNGVLAEALRDGWWRLTRTISVLIVLQKVYIHFRYLRVFTRTRHPLAQP